MVLALTNWQNCWIGAKVTILDGTIIGDNSVVAAGAVVRGQFPDNCVIGGIPAKIYQIYYNNHSIYVIIYMYSVSVKGLSN